MIRLRFLPPAEDFSIQLAHGRENLLPCLREYQFHPHRRWRFDFAWPEQKVAVEVEGGTWSVTDARGRQVGIGGRHVRGVGFENDCEKYAEALCLGWVVIRVTSRQVREGKALAWLQRALNLKGRNSENS